MGDFCFEYEKHQPVIYLMVPGEGREPELVKLYMERTDTRWDEPGELSSPGTGTSKEADADTAAIQTPHWTGLFLLGKLSGGEQIVCEGY